MKLGAFEANQTFLLGAGQELQPISDGYMVYKSATEKIHHLTSAKAILYELCGAGYSVIRMGGVLKQAYALDYEPLDMVHDGLTTLLADQLVSLSGEAQ